MSEALDDKQEKEMLQRYRKTHAKPKLMKAPKTKKNIIKISQEEINQKIYNNNFKRIYNILKLNNNQLPWRLLTENNNNELENFELIYEWDEKIVKEYLESNNPYKNIKDAIKKINLIKIVDQQNIPLYKEIPNFDHIKANIKIKNKNLLENIQSNKLKIETAKKIEKNIFNSNKDVENLNEIGKKLNREVSKYQLEKYIINNKKNEENKVEIDTKIDLINKRMNILMQTVEYFNKKYSKKINIDILFKHFLREHLTIKENSKIRKSKKRRDKKKLNKKENKYELKQEKNHKQRNSMHRGICNRLFKGKPLETCYLEPPK